MTALLVRLTPLTLWLGAALALHASHWGLALLLLVCAVAIVLATPTQKGGDRAHE